MWQTCRGNRAHQAPLLLCYSICCTGRQNLHGLDVGQQHAELLSAHQFWMASADHGGRLVQLLHTRCGMYGFRCQHSAVEVVPSCICRVLRNRNFRDVCRDMESFGAWYHLLHAQNGQVSRYMILLGMFSLTD